MKKITRAALVCFCLLGLKSIAISQSFDYTSLGYSTSLCNVFNATPLKVISGKTHYPVSGGVSYDAALILQTRGGQTLSTSLGTAFAIGVAIKKNYKYSISVTAKKTSADGSSAPILEVGAITTLPDPNTTDPVSCGAVNKNKWGGLQSNYIGGTYVNTTSFTSYPVVQNFTSNDNYNYLTILAHDGSESQYSNVYISAITITETAPIAFTLTPSIVPIQCGSSVTQTFSINNVNSTSGVTGYVWNLGSTSNGWNYNGSAAPQTITTNSPTLTLTSTTCASVSGISAVAQVGSTNYNTNSSTINVTLPTLSISGATAICNSTSQTYTVQNLPCGATVSWTVTPSSYGIVSQSVSGNQLTLTAQGNGQVTIAAAVNGACGGNNLSIPSRVVDVAGTYPSTSYITGWDYTVYTNALQYLRVDDLPGANFDWSVTSAPVDYGYAFDGNGLNQVNFTPYFAGTYNLQVTITHACGTYYAYGSAVVYDNFGSQFMVSPNPASTTITISQRPKAKQLKTLPTQTDEISLVRLYDNFGTLKKQFKCAPGTKQVEVKVSDLKTGLYYVEITSGSKTERQQLIIKP